MRGVLTFVIHCTCGNIFNTIKTSGHSSLEKYTFHFIWKGSKELRKVLSVRGELETEQNGNILTPTLLAITAFHSRSLGLLNRRPGGPASAGTWFSFNHLSPTDLNFQSPGLYNNLTFTYFLWASHFILNSTRRQSRLSLNILDRTHLLFTQVHFPFWQLGRCQYTTHWLHFCKGVKLPIPNCVLDMALNQLMARLQF